MTATEARRRMALQREVAAEAARQGVSVRVLVARNQVTYAAWVRRQDGGAT